MNTMKTLSAALAGGVCLACIGWSTVTRAEEAELEADIQTEAKDAAPLYRTREERRDAGPQTELWPGTTVSRLIEIEALRDAAGVAGSDDHELDREESVTLELSLLMGITDFAELEAVIEYDSDTDKVEGDEVFLTLEHDDWDLSLGRQYTPLGEYHSSFINGPLLEFAETRSDFMVATTYGPSDELDITLAAYHGRADEVGSDRPWDWSAGAEIGFDDWTAGVSYQSDLADSDERLLEDEGNRYRRRVPAASAYLQWQGERMDVTVEVVSALREFAELDVDKNQPVAWNIEALYLVPGYPASLALRVEGSDELDEAPSQRVGVAAIWRFLPYAELTVEYLRGRYARGFAETGDERPVDHVDQFGARVSIAF